MGFKPYLAKKIPNSQNPKNLMDLQDWGYLFIYEYIYMLHIVFLKTHWYWCVYGTKQVRLQIGEEVSENDPELML